MAKWAQVYPKPAFDEGWVHGTVDYISGEQGWKRDFSTFDKEIIAFVYDDGGTFSWAVDVNGAQVASEWDRGSAEDAMAEAEDWVAAELVASVPFASRRAAAAMGDSVRDWYMATFPTDDLGGDILPHVTFSNAMLQLVNHPGEDFYDYIGVGDSLIRERIFAEAADILGCDYDAIYNAWLHGDDGSLKNVLLNHRASRKMRKAYVPPIKLDWSDDGVDYNGDHWWFAYYGDCEAGICLPDGFDGSEWDAYQWEIWDESIGGTVKGPFGEPSLEQAMEGCEAAMAEYIGPTASRKTASDSFAIPGTDYALAIDGFYILIMKGGHQIGSVRYDDGMSEYKLCGDVLDQIGKPRDDEEREELQEAIFDAAYDVIGWYRDGMFFDYASRKTAKNFPTLDEFKHTTGVFGDDQWVYEDDRFYMVIGKELHGVVSDDTWGWEIAWEDQHSDLIAIDLHDTYSLEECYQDLRNDAFSGRIHSLWYDDMKDVVFGSRKKASEDEVEVNFTGEYCDGYVYISYDNDGDLLCDIDVECWGDNGEDVLDTTVSIPASYSAQNIAIELVGAAESEYGDDLGVDESYLVEQIAYYFGKSASRKRAAVALEDMERRGDNSYVQKLIDGSGNELELQVTLWSNGWDWLLKDSDDVLIADSDYTTFGSPYEALADFNDWCDFNVNGRKAALRKKSYSDTFEYGFYDKDDEFRGGNVHIEDDGEYGVWLVEIYGINGDSFEGYGSGDTPSEAARDACEDLDMELPEKEISDFLDHLEFSMTDPMEGGWTGVF